MKKLLLVALAAVALAAPATGGARPIQHGDGCTVIVPEQYGGSNCRYIAGGPGSYTVASFVSHWRIEVTRDGGKTWITLAHGRSVIDERPVPGAYPVFVPQTGDLATQPGDLVNISISLQRFCVPTTPADCRLARAGYISAADKNE